MRRNSIASILHRMWSARDHDDLLQCRGKKVLYQPFVRIYAGQCSYAFNRIRGFIRARRHFRRSKSEHTTVPAWRCKVRQSSTYKSLSTEINEAPCNEIRFPKSLVMSSFDNSEILMNACQFIVANHEPAMH